MIFHSHANKTHFHKKGWLYTWPQFESEGFWNSEVAYHGKSFINRNVKQKGVKRSIIKASLFR